MRTSIRLLLGTTTLVVAMHARAELTAVTQYEDRMISDSTLDVTWTDMVSGSTSWNTSCNGVCPGSPQAWVAQLNAMHGGIGYGGFNDWAVPTGDGTQTILAGDCASLKGNNEPLFTGDGQGCGSSTSATGNQLSYLFINELGNTPGAPLASFVPFTTLNFLGVGNEPPNYWSSSVTTSGIPWSFTSGGFEVAILIGDIPGYTIAVRSGQVMATPAFSVTGGTYTSAQMVILSDASAGATIYYTTDGTAPTKSSAIYTSPISVNDSLTLQAMALGSSGQASLVATAAYTIASPGSAGGGSFDGVLVTVLGALAAMRVVRRRTLS
jgi:Chitobiase/beta-hexosaminidase C-terminal domain